MRSNASTSRSWIGRDLVGAPLVVDGEDLLLGPADHFARIERRLVGVAEDFGAGVDQRPQRGLVADDLGIVDGVGGVGHRVERPRPDRPAPPIGLQIAGRAQPLQQQRGVDAAALVVHRQQVGVELLVGVGVEIVGPKHQRHVVAEVRVQQDAAQHALFGVEVVRRQAVEYFGTNPGRRAAGVGAIGGGHGSGNC